MWADAGAWVHFPWALPAIFNLYFGDSCVGWCGRMGPLSVGPPRNLQFVLRRQLRGLMQVHGSTFRGPSLQSPICTSETAVWADVGAWVHFPWALPTISILYFGDSRVGWRGCMGPLSVGPPRNLHHVLLLWARRAVWAHGCAWTHGWTFSTHLPQYQCKLQGWPLGSLRVGWAHR